MLNRNISVNGPIAEPLRYDTVLDWRRLQDATAMVAADDRALFRRLSDAHCHLVRRKGLVVAAFTIERQNPTLATFTVSIPRVHTHDLALRTACLTLLESAAAAIGIRYRRYDLLSDASNVCGVFRNASPAFAPLAVAV